MKNSAFNTTGWIIASSFAIAALGFLIPFWPLSALGILIAGLSGRWWLALIMGILFDAAYGAPVGRLHYLYVPFTLLALLSILIRIIAQKYLLSKSHQEHL
jgi:hypothetical protein